MFLAWTYACSILFWKSTGHDDDGKQTHKRKNGETPARAMRLLEGDAKGKQTNLSTALQEEEINIGYAQS